MVRGGRIDDRNCVTEDGTDYGIEDYMGDGIGDDDMWKGVSNHAGVLYWVPMSW
jgi:hypothetical protein